MEYPKEIIKKIYRSLPSELMQVVATPETSAIVNDIAKTYLDPKQKKGLGDEITTRLLGLTTEASFTARLQDRLKIPEPTATKLVDSLKARIFSKIPGSVMANQEINAQRIISEAEQPIIITRENKAEALKEMNRRENAIEPKPAPTPIPPPNLPQNEIHNSLPMIETGEVVHDVPHVETKLSEVKIPQPPIPPSTAPVSSPVAPLAPELKKSSIPTHSPRYEQGMDPYREPLV